MTPPTLSAILPLPGFVRQAGPKTYTPVSTWLIVSYVFSVSQSADTALPYVTKPNPPVSERS